MTSIMTATSPTVGFNQPAWASTVVAKYKAGVAHAFVLHFNVADYVALGWGLPRYLAAVNTKCQIVLYYNRSSGFRVAQPSMKALADRLLAEGGGAAPNLPTDPMAAALAAMTGSNQPKPAPADPASTETSLDLPKAPAAALQTIERLLKAASEAKDEQGKPTPMQVAVIVEYAESIIPDAEMAMLSPEDRTNVITIQRWGTDPRIQQGGHRIFLLTANLTSLHNMVRAASSKYEAVEIGLPDAPARADFINQYVTGGGANFDWRMEPAGLIAATAGLSRLHIEDIFLRAAQDGVLTYELVKERKDDIIASEFGEVLEIVDPEYGFEAVGGLEWIKDFFRRSVIRPLQTANTRRVPQGVLLLGPAGTGKSVMAKALAKEANVNFVNLNLARIFQGLVGSSERNLEKALRAIESLAPTIVFIDEIDQAISRGGSGDSGTSNRVFKRILEFMADTSHRGKVIFLAASNRPDLIDAALRRPGRFDKKIAFLVPEAAERINILKVLAQRYGLIAEGEQLTLLPDTIERTDKWTGAELEAAIVKALELVDDEDLTTIEAIEQAVQRLRPSTADVELMTRLAILESNDTDLLPPKYRAMLDNRQQTEAEVAAMLPTGRSSREM